ncbi:MAG: hypothetical protein H6574_17375 [Lewinellaceae bacterium]|nr:hypothetical protein [Lewinellaceae bacterium]
MRFQTMLIAGGMLLLAGTLTAQNNCLFPSPRLPSNGWLNARRKHSPDCSNSASRCARRTRLL